MKIFALTLLFFISSFGWSQNLKRHIENGNLKALTKYVNGNDVLDDFVVFKAGSHTYNDKDVTFHPLVYAANQNQLEIVKLFVEHKDKIEDFHNVMSKAFVTSLGTKNDELISYLYALNPNVNEFCGFCYGRNAIMIAASYGLEKWYFKLKPNSDLHLKDELGYTLLHLAALSSNLTILNDVLTIDEIDINEKNIYGKTALHLTAIDSAETLYFSLIKKGVEIDDTDELFSDITIGGNLKIFNDFIQKYPNPNLWKNYQFLGNKEVRDYPLENAILSNNTTIIFWVLDQMIKELNTKKSNNKIEILYNLLNGTDYDAIEYYVSLTEAIENGNKDVFVKLLETNIWFNDQAFINTNIESDYDNYYTIYFSKFDYKDAKKAFGEEFVDSLYEELDIEF